MTSSNHTFSPRQLAQALGVSESSIKRWVDAGEIRASRTSGGHRRVTQREAVRFIREQGIPVVDPVALGLKELMPALAVMQEHAVTAEVLIEAFTSMEAGQGGALLVAEYLRGVPLPALFDGPLREAMHHLGTLWNEGEEGILYEHRATDVLLQAVSQLRALVPPPRASAPVAVGGAFEADPYLLPSLLVATVLADRGLRVTNLGPHTPVTVLAETAQRAEASLVWFSTSVPIPADRIGREVAALHSELRGVPLVIGGREAPDAVPSLDGVYVLPSLQALDEFVRSRWPSRSTD